MYTSAAYDMGRGSRSNVTAGLPLNVPGPGAHELPDDLDPFKNELKRKGIS